VLESLRHDARFALRSLARSPGYTLAVVASLALGMGASVAAFGVIDAVRLRALPFPDADRLVVLSEVPSTGQPPDPGCALRGSCRSGVRSGWSRSRRCGLIGARRRLHGRYA
jgi:hypothetical protein